MRINNTTQRVAAEILAQFMFAKDMDEVWQIWDSIYKQYELCDDPFTYCPCSLEDYYKSKLEFDKQVMFEMYGHCDGLE